MAEHSNYVLMHPAEMPSRTKKSIVCDPVFLSLGLCLKSHSGFLFRKILTWALVDLHHPWHGALQRSCVNRCSSALTFQLWRLWLVHPSFCAGIDSE